MMEGWRDGWRDGGRDGGVHGQIRRQNKSLQGERGQSRAAGRFLGLDGNILSSRSDLVQPSPLAGDKSDSRREATPSQRCGWFAAQIRWDPSSSF